MHLVSRERRAIDVGGTVQGVGFRPFAVRMAAELGLSGWVKNDGLGVQLEIEGRPEELDRFVTALEQDAPPLAVVRAISASVIPLEGDTGFEVVASVTGQPGLAAVPADVAPCAQCLTELNDPANHRFGYPFICCTDCGPRYTVVRDLPYDRERTSMACFALCERCRAEYEDPADRRFHAQATCCARCGPQLDLAVAEAVELLRAGAILALKGLGGYQLMCRADQAEPVGRLRARKHREQKPFAVLVGSVALARRLAVLDGVAERALVGPEAPIVLAPTLTGHDEVKLAAEVGPGTGLVGLMLPSTPLHRLLVDGAGVPLVCTSGNRSEEPIAVDDETARAHLGSIADAFLSHGRKIERRADDSVGQVVHGRFQLLRRARGFAPRPVALTTEGPPVLAVGAELKSTVCLAVGASAGLSVHLGDLENPATLRAFEEAIADQLALTGIEPQLVVHDLHPEYLSTKFARSQDLAPTLGVQHHHAHLAACLADNQHPGPAIGVTFDGLGWGPDGTAWGGEILVGDVRGYVRAAHLRAVALPGGAAAIRQPWRMAVAHLVSAFGIRDAGTLPPLPGSAVEPNALEAVVDLCQDQRSVATSSMGRLFDAVAVLCGLGRQTSYEGQAAIGLEQLAARAEPSAGYRWERAEGDTVVVDPGSLIRAIAEDVGRGVSPSVIAARFHRSVAELVLELCEQQRATGGLNVVALTGGVFQNRLLVELTVPLLESAGFDVLRHAQVPPNDGGISLGQAVIGRAHLAPVEVTYGEQEG